jgi:hypothetical protein
MANGAGIRRNSLAMGELIKGSPSLVRCQFASIPKAGILVTEGFLFFHLDTVKFTLNRAGERDGSFRQTSNLGRTFHYEA